MGQMVVLCTMSWTGPHIEERTGELMWAPKPVSQQLQHHRLKKRFFDEKDQNHKVLAFFNQWSCFYMCIFPFQWNKLLLIVSMCILWFLWNWLNNFNQLPTQLSQIVVLTGAGLNNKLISFHFISNVNTVIRETSTLQMLIQSLGRLPVYKC